VTTTVASQQSDEEVLRECLEEVVAKKIRGRPSPVAHLERKRSQYSSFYASDIITVRLESGEEFKVFLKDFGSFHHPKDTMKERREREVVVYRDLLDGAGLNTARYYGSVWDEAEGRYWLLLEFVEGVPVRHLDFEAWLPAVAWLGRMYGHFVARPELWGNCDVLARHDASFFETTAEQAMRSVTEFSADLGRRLDPIVRRYHKAVAVMTGQPRTLVHGTYRPAQIITDDPGHPKRICPVDWEKAAVGASLYDLTFIVDGFDPERLHRLFEAYRAEARRCGVRVGDDAEMKLVVDCFRLHRVMNWLAVSLARRYEPRVIHKLIGMAEEVGTLVL
jgi:hypothetical protein